MDQHPTPSHAGDVRPAAPRESRGGNLLFLLVAAAAGVALYKYFGPEGLWNVCKAALGLGFVIFLHELGHFAVAKWCDVHVETFSIGFGPAIPGLSFVRGETTYKIGMVPLGGYVKMLGEGSESEEDDANPRSFKNKTVGQRMMIISAGVVMNLILGCVCFILAYQGGVKMTPAVIGFVDPGSPAYGQGIRSGDVVQRIGDIEKPYFEDLLYSVMLSRSGERFQIVLARPDGTTRVVDVEPRREATDSKPVIGVATPPRLQLLTERLSRKRVSPAVGPAAAARVLGLKPGEVVWAASDPKNPDELVKLPKSAVAPQPLTDFAALGERFRQMAGQPIKLQIHESAGYRTVELLPGALQYGDQIVGSTDPDLQNADQYDPYRVSRLPPDERTRQDGQPDYFEFRRRMQVLAGKPVVLQVQRESAADEAPISVLMPPAFRQVIPGLRMKMGKVKAVRNSSPGAEAGVQPNDRLLRVELSDGTDTMRFVGDKAREDQPGVSVKRLDPLRLPDDLRRWAAGRKNVRVVLVVGRENPETKEAEEPRTLSAVPWDGRWQFDLETPVSLSSPLSIPELGIAYFVETCVDGVEPGSPAAQAGVQEGDVFLTVRFKEPRKKDEPADWGLENELYKDKGVPEPWWAAVFERLQDPEVQAVKVKIKRGGEEKEIELPLETDRDWPQIDRGLRLMPDSTLEKADGPLQAVEIGAKRTWQMVVKTYMGLLSMVTGRVSATKNLHGPIFIADAAYNIAGDSLPQFLWFLAVISVNLAVINFLPIPVLDGGHMVFLIYEKLRGRPASEQMRLGLTYIGLLLILSLMAFVIYLDVKRYWFSG